MKKQVIINKIKKLTIGGVALATLMLGNVAAAAGHIYLNGVKIDGVTGQTFDGCKVTIDDNGDIYIIAKGYQVQAIGGDSAPAPLNATAAVVNSGASNTPTAPVAQASAVAPAGPVTMNYWLVTENAVPGMSQYDIDIYINNKFVKKLSSKEQQVVMNVSKFLKKGNNTVYVLAKKNLSEGRLSTSPAHYFKVLIGESATPGGKEVYIDKEVLSYTRTAAEDQDYSDMINVIAK